MALKTHEKNLNSHPICSLKYDVCIERRRFGQKFFAFEKIRDVEQAIDQVFEWLTANGQSHDEIEHLAPYFGSLWPSAIALAEFIAQIGEDGRLSEKSLIEVGCGLAVPGLVASSFGTRVTLSDGHPDVYRFIKRNFELNPGLEADFIQPNWNEKTSKVGTFDFVIASDILYEAYHAEFFAKHITSLAHEKTRVIVTDPGRAYIQKFVTEMNQLGWRETIKPWTVYLDSKSRDTFLIELCF